PPGGGIRALSRHREVARRASAPRRRHARRSPRNAKTDPERRVATGADPRVESTARVPAGRVSDRTSARSSRRGWGRPSAGENSLLLPVRAQARLRIEEQLVGSTLVRVSIESKQVVQ